MALKNTITLLESSQIRIVLQDERIPIARALELGMSFVPTCASSNGSCLHVANSICPKMLCIHGVPVLEYWHFLDYFQQLGYDGKIHIQNTPKRRNEKGSSISTHRYALFFAKGDEGIGFFREVVRGMPRNSTCLQDKDPNNGEVCQKTSEN